ncbi:MAG: SOS response-associated peptidase [Sphingomonadaceae bacterium]
MCTLYALKTTRAQVADLFRAVDPTPEAGVPAEVYPRRVAPVIRQAGGARLLEDMRWGFPPPPGVRSPVVNVRNLDSPFWRGALADPARRCLVPVTAFCEWEGPAGVKVKRWFRLAGDPLFAFAGLWRPTEEGPVFAFLTTEPNELVAPIHPKAMPVILAPSDRATWLEAPMPVARLLARPYPAEAMAVD